MITYTFATMAELADWIEAKGKDIRARVPSASSEASKRTMRAEAHAYEQSAMIIRNSNILASK